MPLLLYCPVQQRSVEGAFNMYSIIKHFEDCRLEAYKDSAGIPTIGYGHTKAVRMGDICNQAQAEKWLEEDLQDARTRVGRALVGTNTVLDDNEFEVLVSLAYNLRSFEQLAKHLPDKDKFKRKMLLYAKDVSGNFLKGLKIRRICERLLFEGKEWFTVAVELQDRNKTIEDVKQKERELWS
jgi:GH24 family phage-related lysozyme (muramidase)